MMIFPSRFENKLQELPPLITLKKVAKILFDDDSNANCQVLRRMTERGQFPKPTIPAEKKGGKSLYAPMLILAWYEELNSDENKNKLVKG